MPRRFDQHATQMAVACFGDAALGAFGAARVLGEHQAHVRHRAGRCREATWVAELRGDGKGGEIVDAAEAPQALHAVLQRLERQQAAQIIVCGSAL